MPDPLPAADLGAPPSHLLYLHGFRSSPKSFKALRLQAWFTEHRPDLRFACPQLPPSPKQAIETIAQLTADWPDDRMAVIGSSLGGFYATVTAERVGCPAVVLNPAVNPTRDLARYIGEQSMFHDPDQHFFFRAEFVAELQAMTPAAITRPDRYFAVIAKGDEVLDWHEMHARYGAAAIHLVDGSDHALSDFDDHLPLILRFLNLENP